MFHYQGNFKILKKNILPPLTYEGPQNSGQFLVNFKILKKKKLPPLTMVPKNIIFFTIFSIETPSPGYKLFVYKFFFILPPLTRVSKTTKTIFFFSFKHRNNISWIYVDISSQQIKKYFIQKNLKKKFSGGIDHRTNISKILTSKFFKIKVTYNF